MVCFSNSGTTKGTNSLKVLCLMFVFVFCRLVSGLILWFLDNLWLDDLGAEEIGDRLKVAFSPDVILCGVLGSRYLLTN